MRETARWMPVVLALGVPSALFAGPHAPASRSLDATLVAKCKSFTGSDCQKASARPVKARLTEPLSGKSDKVELPKEARRDATAGVFI